MRSCPKHDSKRTHLSRGRPVRSTRTRLTSNRIMWKGVKRQSSMLYTRCQQKGTTRMAQPFPQRKHIKLCRELLHNHTLTHTFHLSAKAHWLLMSAHACVASLVRCSRSRSGWKRELYRCLGELVYWCLYPGAKVYFTWVAAALRRISRPALSGR